MVEKESVHIDFVIPWVDGNDPDWLANKNVEMERLGIKNQLWLDDVNSESRYREMGLLKYWFRGVEKFAPWVNKVFFITCGQKPEWINENNPKLVLVNHKDYIPSDYLPTFNSRTIDLNLHRINNLSEHFVLFNDDVFLLKPVSPEFFFKHGQPVLPANLHISHYYVNNNISKTCINDFCTVNEHFNIAESIWKNRKKWFNVFILGPKLGFMNMLRFIVNKTFSVSGYEHLANPHLKSTFQEVWKESPDIMNFTSMSRFRSDGQVNQWLMIAWNLAKGQFYPVREGYRGSRFAVSSKNINDILNIISRQTQTQLCINDSNMNDNPEFFFREIAQSFESFLSEKSSFEC